MATHSGPESAPETLPAPEPLPARPPSEDDLLRPEIAGASIVVLGRFNPSIFQPQWFSHHELLPQEEADAAEIGLIHPNATMFSTTWLSWEVTQTKLAAGTNDPTMALSLRDLVLSTFQVLEHTPLLAVGLNRHLHFRGNAERLAFLQGTYLPEPIWKSVFEAPAWKSTVVVGKRSGHSSDRVQVKLQPSNQVPFGMFLDFNEHFVIDDDTGRTQLERLGVFTSILKDQWSEFLGYTEETAARLLSARQSATGDYVGE